MPSRSVFPPVRAPASKQQLSLRAPAVIPCLHSVPSQENLRVWNQTCGQLRGQLHAPCPGGRSGFLRTLPLPRGIVPRGEPFPYQATTPHAGLRVPSSSRMSLACPVSSLPCLMPEALGSQLAPPQLCLPLANITRVPSTRPGFALDYRPHTGVDPIIAELSHSLWTCPLGPVPVSPPEPRVR